MLCMMIAMSKKSFLTNSLSPLTHRRKFKPITVTYGKTITCNYSQNDPQKSPGENERKLRRMAMAALIAGVFTLGPVDDASAGRTGGRIGGHRFLSSTPTTKRIVITRKPKKIFKVRPAVDRPQVGGYGYGIGMPIFGSWGWTPFSLLGPGPNVAESFRAGLNLKAILFFVFLGAVAALLRKYFMSITKAEDEEEDGGEDDDN